MRIPGPFLIPILLLLGASLPAQESGLRADAGRKLQARDYEGAIQDYQRALAGLPSQDSAEAADLLLEISKTLYLKGDFGEAAARARSAVEICRRVNGPKHPSVARALTAEAVAMLAAGEYEPASPLFEQALAISRQDPGPENRDTVSLMERYGVDLTRAGH